MKQAIPTLWPIFHPVTMADEVMEREVVEWTEVRALTQVSDTLLVSWCFAS